MASVTRSELDQADPAPGNGSTLLTLCSVSDWSCNRTNPIEVDKWAEKIATGLLSILVNWWTDDDRPLYIFKFLMMSGGEKLLKLRAQELAQEFAQTSCLTFDLKDLVDRILQPVMSAHKDTTLLLVLKLKSLDHLDLFGAATGVGEGQTKKKKKKKKKNKNNQKERLRMKMKTQLEEEGWGWNGPCSLQ